MDKYTDWHKIFPGSGQGKQYPYLEQWIPHHNPNTIIDYGCGKGGTIAWLNTLFPDTHIDGYDPGNEQYRTKPTEHYDLLINCDVLEHIDELDLEHTLQHMASLADTLMLIIDTTPAKKRLPDGRNAHITLWEPNKWLWHTKKYTGFTSTHYEIWTQPDPNFTTRTRLCQTLRRL